MELVVMPSAQPSHIERFVVVVVMCLHDLALLISTGLDAAYLARLSRQHAAIKGVLYGCSRQLLRRATRRLSPLSC
jgi:hypothetical protein